MGGVASSQKEKWKMENERKRDKGKKKTVSNKIIIFQKTRNHKNIFPTKTKIMNSIYANKLLADSLK